MRSVLILFVSALALVWADIDANAQLRPQKHRALNVPYYQNINPKGSFLPIEFSGAVEAPTRVELTNIHSSLASADGTMIRVEVVGGMSHYPLPAPDDVHKSAIAVFVNASGQAIAPGSRTTAAPVGPFSYCDTTIDYPHDFQITDLTRTLYEVEVPAGAVAMLVSPIDCPVHDNHDENGNFKVKVTYPIPQYKFMQGSRINYDYNEDGVVEMLSDEEAQLEVEVGPGLDVSTSKVYWNSVEISSASSGDNTGSSQKITFDLGEIPETPQGIVPVRIWLKDASGQTVSDETVNVFVMPFKTTIYQVVKEPDLDVDGGPDGIVDLVAGKNADVVVRVAPNSYIANAQLMFRSPSGAAYGLVSADGTVSNASGDFTFRLSPVPQVPALSGIANMEIEIKNADGSIITGKHIPVQIRRTKQIRMGFLPISGCGEVSKCFQKTLTSEIENLVKKACLITKALFPVADSDLLCSKEESIINDNFFAHKFPSLPNDQLNTQLGLFMMFEDVFSLEKSYENYIINDQFDYIVGVGGPGYFNYRHQQYAGALGIAYCDIFSLVFNKYYCGRSMIVHHNSPFTMSHELGHLHGLGHAPGDTQTSDGYNNYELKPTFAYEREPLGEKYVLMEDAGGEIGDVNSIWIARDEYLKIFKRNLLDEKKKAKKSNLDFSGIKVNGIFHEEELKIVNTYLVNGELTENDNNGSILAEIKDYNENIISSTKFGGVSAFEANMSGFSVILPSPANAVSINFYKIVNDNSIFLKKVVIPSDIILEELKYVSDKAIAKSAPNTKAQLMRDLGNYRSEIEKSNFSTARRILHSNIFPTIQSGFSSQYIPESINSIDGIKLGNVAISSLARMTALPMSGNEPSNYFVRLESLGQPTINERTSIRIIKLRKPESSSYAYKFRVWFNGVLINYRIEGENILADSTLLTEGQHQWVVQSYLVDKVQLGAFSKSKATLQRENFDFERRLDVENDPQKRDAILKIIQRNIKTIQQLNLEIEKLYTPIGNVVTIGFEI